MSSINGVDTQHRKELTPDEIKKRTRELRVANRYKAEQLQATLLESLIPYGDSHGFGGSDSYEQFWLARNTGGGGYAPPAMASDRRGGAKWPMWRTDIELNRLRQDSRIVFASNAYAKGLVKNITNYVIGKGMGYKSTPKKSDKAKRFQGIDQLTAGVDNVMSHFCARNGWNASAGANDVDEDGGVASSSSTKERESYWRVLRDGEVFIRLFYRDDGNVDVRFVSPELVWGTPPGETQADGWSYGIKHRVTEDGEDQERIEAYYVRNRDVTHQPIDGRDYLGGEIVPASEMIHIKDSWEDAEVKRGTPALSYDTLDALLRASKLQRNISVSAAVRAATAEVWKHSVGSQAQIQSLENSRPGARQVGNIDGITQRTEQLIYPGMIRRTPQGQEPVPFPTTTNVPEHQQAAQGDLRQACAGFTAPEYMTGTTNEANFATASESGAPFVRSAESEQEHFKVGFTRLMWRVIRHAVKCQRLPQEALELVTITAESQEVKKNNDGELATVRASNLQNKITSPQIEIMRIGNDPVQVIDDWKKWDAEMGGGQQPGGMMPGTGPDGGDDPDGGDGDPQGDGGHPLDSVPKEQLSKDHPQDVQESYQGSLFGGGAEVKPGFTGEITDKLGRKVKFQDGKRVGGEKAKSKDSVKPSAKLGKESVEIVSHDPDRNLVKVRGKSGEETVVHTHELHFGGKPQPGERAATANASYHDMIAKAKAARVEAFNSVKADAQKASKKLEEHVDAMAKLFDEGITADTENDQPIYDVEIEIQGYRDADTVHDKYEALKSIEQVAGDALEHEQEAETPESKAKADAAMDARRKLRDAQDEREAYRQKINAFYDKGDEAGGNAFAEKTKEQFAEMNRKVDDAQSEVDQLDDDDGMTFTPEEIAKNKSSLKLIAKHAREARKYLKAFVQYRKEMQSIKEGSTGDVREALDMMDVGCGVDLLEASEPANPDTEDLANFYAETWGSITPEQIGEEEIATVNDELAGGDYSLSWDDEAGKWVVTEGVGGVLMEAVHHAPKGGVTINGKKFKGGMFIPQAEYEKATPEEKKKIDEPAKAASDARKARGSVDTDKVRSKIKDKHGHHELTAAEKTSAKRSLNALIAHHGEMTVHRLEEIADSLHAAYGKLPEDEEGQRTQFSRRLKAIEHMLDMAKEKGHEGKVAELAKPADADLDKETEPENPAASGPAEPDRFPGQKRNPGGEDHGKEVTVIAGPHEGKTGTIIGGRGQQVRLKNEFGEFSVLDEDVRFNEPVPEPAKAKEPEKVEPNVVDDTTIQAQEKNNDKQPAVDARHDGGTPADGSLGGNDGGRGDRPTGPPRIITVREQHTKQGDPSLVPELLRQHLNDAQVQGASLAIDALEKHKGFLLADGTGVGKTRQQLAVAQAFLDKGKKVLIVSPAEVIKPNWGKGSMSGSFAYDSEQMGVPVKLAKGAGGISPGSVHITTYNELGKIKDHVDANTVVIFDESHFMKNRDSQRFKHGKDASDKAGAVMFATATPADKPLHIAHLAKANVFGNAGMSETYHKLGMRLAEVHIGGGQTRKVWQIDPKVGYKESARRMSGLFDQMTKDGLMIKRELSMDRVAVGMDRVKLSDEEHASMKSVYDNVFSETNGNKAVALMAARMHQEPFKIPSTVQMVKDELAAGRMPVVFMGRVNDITDEDDDGEESVQSEGTAKALKAALIAAGVPEEHIGELHGGATKTAEQKKKAMADFQSGKRKVMLATIQSGGTGINLDDTTGESPRTLIMMTPPFTANDMAQALGRVNRLNTKSDVKVRGVLADTAIDDWNAKLLEKKFQMLGAVVGGNAERGMEAIRPEGAPDDEEGGESAFDWGESLHPVEKAYHNTPFNHNDLIGKFGGKRMQRNGEWTTQFPSQKHLDDYKASVASSSKPPEQKKSSSSFFVSGNTYAHKDKIKAAGGRWDPVRGGWTIPSHAKAKISHLNGLRFSEN